MTRNSVQNAKTCIITYDNVFVCFSLENESDLVLEPGILTDTVGYETHSTYGYSSPSCDVMETSVVISQDEAPPTKKIKREQEEQGKDILLYNTVVK